MSILEQLNETTSLLDDKLVFAIGLTALLAAILVLVRLVRRRASAGHVREGAAVCSPEGQAGGGQGFTGEPSPAADLHVVDLSLTFKSEGAEASGLAAAIVDGRQGEVSHVPGSQLPAEEVNAGALQADNSCGDVLKSADPIAREPAQDGAVNGAIAAGMRQTRSSFFNRLKGLFSSRSRIDTSALDDLEELLILSDVGARCASELVDSVREAVKSQREVDQGTLTELLKEGVRRHLIQVSPEHRIYSGVGSPLIVLVVGVNGVGKTTTVAKLAARYQESGKRVLVVAADTFRAAAVQQLEEWSRRIGFDVVKGAENAKPAAVVFDGMLAAKRSSGERGDEGEQSAGAAYDVVLIDTAGRLHTKANLMQELSGVRNSISRHFPDGPHETVLVVDGVSGQNALMQAREFHEVVSLSGVVVTKLDGTPKGGIVIPISQELKIPVFYVGVGEKAADLVPFVADEFVNGMFDTAQDGASGSHGGGGYPTVACGGVS
jgi:fused signal recognition particle receptor